MHVCHTGSFVVSLSQNRPLNIARFLLSSPIHSLRVQLSPGGGKNVVSPWREEAKGRRLSMPPLCKSVPHSFSCFLVLSLSYFKNPIRARRLDTSPPAYLSLCFLSGIDHYDWHALTQNKSESHCPFVSRARKAGEWCETYLLLEQILKFRLKVPWALLLNVFSSCIRKYGLQFNMTQVDWLTHNQVLFSLSGKWIEQQSNKEVHKRNSFFFFWIIYTNLFQICITFHTL